MSDGEGCLGIIFLIALIWVPLHFSGYSILVWREGRPLEGQYSVECKYLNSTGIESRFRFFASEAWADTYYCPRTKKVGE